MNRRGAAAPGRGTADPDERKAVTPVKARRSGKVVLHPAVDQEAAQELAPAAELATMDELWDPWKYRWNAEEPDYAVKPWELRVMDAIGRFWAAVAICGLVATVLAQVILWIYGR